MTITSEDKALEFDLIDDGTLDTVISVHCNDCDRVWEERFGDTSDYRDSDTGVLDFDAFLNGYASDIYCDCESEE